MPLIKVCPVNIAPLSQAALAELASFTGYEDIKTNTLMINSL